jgi:hypothetical protein
MVQELVMAYDIESGPTLPNGSSPKAPEKVPDPEPEKNPESK